MPVTAGYSTTMLRDRMTIASAALVVAGAVALVAATVAAMLTHIILCIQTSQWFLLIAGAIFAPVGVVHGVGHWLGAW